MPEIRQKDDVCRNAQTGTDHVSIDRFLKVWGEILSDHYGLTIKFTATKKEVSL